MTEQGFFSMTWLETAKTGFLASNLIFRKLHLSSDIRHIFKHKIHGYQTDEKRFIPNCNN